jgi:hypothetical protein
MAMHFEELDAITRRFMLEELEAELTGANPYVSKALAPDGRVTFGQLMRTAIESGDDETLTRALDDPRYWNAIESYTRNGVTRERLVNTRQAAERLALGEFNTWYVRGFARRLMSEGVAQCQAYRGADPKWEPAECTAHEGQLFSVAAIYRGHRARHWPNENPMAFSIPFGPGCHHTIRRISPN